MVLQVFREPAQQVGERTAEQIKMEIGSAYPLEKPLTMEVKGRNLIEGVPRTVTIDDSEIREALSECVATILNACRVALERTPPELSADGPTAELDRKMLLDLRDSLRSFLTLLERK